MFAFTQPSGNEVWAKFSHQIRRDLICWVQKKNKRKKTSSQIEKKQVNQLLDKESLGRFHS